MKKILTLLPCFLLFSCSISQKTTQAVDDNYGYSPENPINVYVNSVNAINQRIYLSSLCGPNGEQVYFKRLQSCCPFKSKNALFDKGYLDIYAVTYEGKKDTVQLYLNMYESGNFNKTPNGFRFKHLSQPQK